MRASLETRIKSVYPAGNDWERADDQLARDEYAERVRHVLEKCCSTLPLRVTSERWSNPCDMFAFTHIDCPEFGSWIGSMDNPAKLRWIEENKSPYYVVFWVKVSRVADYYVTFFNHWRPRGDTGYLDADFRQEPSDEWRRYSKSVLDYFAEQGFLIASPELLQEKVPFVLTWGGDEIPDDDPRWDDDAFEPDPVEATVYDCLFGDE